MLSVDVFQPTFYVVAMPLPCVTGPNLMLNAALPQAMHGEQPLLAQTFVAKRATTSQVDMADHGSFAGKVWQMSQEPAQCHEVQKLLEDSSESVKVAIAEELRGHICDGSRHPYANFVVQKCIEVLRPEASQFIVDELMSADTLSSVAQHKFGCRIVQRLLEYCRGDQVFELILKILPEALLLMTSHYGIYVIQHLLQYASRKHQLYLLDLMMEHVRAICSSNTSCALVNTVLSNGEHADSIALAHSILECGLLATMARTRHGHLAVKTLLELFEGSFECRLAHRQILDSRHDLNKTRYGRSIVRFVEGKCVSDTCHVFGTSKLSEFDGNRRMSWADLSSDTENDF